MSTLYDASIKERERLRAENSSLKELAKMGIVLAEAVEYYSQSAHHSPCCSGGLGPEGIVPNVCTCEARKLRELALAILERSE